MPPDPNALNKMEQLVFGADARRHVLTNRILEQGSGALSEQQQAWLHLSAIEADQGVAASQAMRVRLWKFYSVPAHQIEAYLNNLAASDPAAAAEMRQRWMAGPSHDTPPRRADWPPLSEAVDLKDEPSSVSPNTSTRLQ